MNKEVKKFLVTVDIVDFRVYVSKIISLEIKRKEFNEYSKLMIMEERESLEGLLGVLV